MAVKVYKPTTPARRRTSVDTFSDITKKRPEKKLIKAKKRKGGRNAHGRITVRHRGGGAKQFYRLIDYKRTKFDVPAIVEAIEYDPNRKARIALIKYEDGQKAYMIAPVGLEVGATVVSSKTRTEIAPGNRMPLKHVPLGSNVYNVELTPGKGAQIVRSAGSLAKLMALDAGKATLRMPSGEVRLVPEGAAATIGQVSNPDAMNIRIGKAGRKRHMGVKPTVRGKAMNPTDHPHGGGEGSTPIGMKAPKTKWGKKALGIKTRKKNKYSDKMIVRGRKQKRRRK